MALYMYFFAQFCPPVHARARACVCGGGVRACVHTCVYAVYIIVTMISQYNKKVYRCCDQLFVQVLIPFVTTSDIYRHKKERKKHTNNKKETLQANKNG